MFCKIKNILMKTPPSTIAVCTVTRLPLALEGWLRKGFPFLLVFEDIISIRIYRCGSQLLVKNSLVLDKIMNNNVYRNAVSDNKKIYIVGLMQ